MSNASLLFGFVLFISGVVVGAIQCHRCKEIYPGSGERLGNFNVDCQEVYECPSSSDTCYSHWAYEVATGKLVIDKGCAMKADCELNKARTEINYKCSQYRTKWQCYECCSGGLCNKSDTRAVTAPSATITAGLCVSLLWTLLN